MPDGSASARRGARARRQARADRRRQRDQPADPAAADREVGDVRRETESPAEALDWIRRGDPFDVALLDYQMPEMDGIALAREIRGTGPAPCDRPAVVDRPAAPATRRPGFAAVLSKPLRLSHLHDRLLEVVGRARIAYRPRCRVRTAPASRRRPAADPAGRGQPGNQKVALRLLERLGYQADVAANGREVLERLERAPYDVVLMDVQMPEMDGLEASRAICARWPLGAAAHHRDDRRGDGRGSRACLGGRHGRLRREAGAPRRAEARARPVSQVRASPRPARPTGPGSPIRRARPPGAAGTPGRPGRGRALREVIATFLEGPRVPRPRRDAAAGVMRRGRRRPTRSKGRAPCWGPRPGHLLRGARAPRPERVRFGTSPNGSLRSRRCTAPRGGLWRLRSAEPHMPQEPEVVKDQHVTSPISDTRPRDASPGTGSD